MAHSHLTLSRFPKARVHELIVIWSYLLLQLAAAMYGTVLLVSTYWFGGSQVTTTHLALFLSMYLLTLAGISLANHRQFSHPSYRTHLWMKYIFYSLAAMAFQGKIRAWGTDHRHHHRHPDTPCTQTPPDKGCDVHTPLDGFWHALVGWEIRKFNRPIDLRWEDAEQRLEIARARGNQEAIDNLTELRENDRLTRFFDRTALLWLSLGLLIPMIIGGWSAGYWSTLAAWYGLLWGGLIRLFAVNLSTSLINSYTHKPGWLGNYRHNPSAKDSSQNNILLGLLTLNPEVLHANHHQVPNSANHAIYWWEYFVDWSSWILFVLEKLGLVWNVRWTTPAQFEDVIIRSTQGRR